MDLSGIPQFVLGAIIGGVFAIVGAHINARAQERTAKLRIDADIRLQADRLGDAVASADLAWRRTKLEELYVFLSDVAAQCSQTQAQLDYQMGRDLEKHMARWTELRGKLGRARTAAVTFPDLSHYMAEIEGRIDDFYWTSQTLLQHDSKAENDGWGLWYKRLIESSDNTAAAVSKVERAIENEARRLAEMAPLWRADQPAALSAASGSSYSRLMKSSQSTLAAGGRSEAR